MHRLSKLDLCLYCKNYTLASNVDLMGYSSFCICLVTNGAKDGIFGALYHASKVHLLYLSIIWQILLSYNFNSCICASFNPNSQHICRGSNCYHLGFMKLVHILLHMVNMFGQATWIQLNFNLYLCERVVINYQKGGD